MAQNELDELYGDDVIRDHHHNPRNSDKLQSPDIVADAVNPFCGDEIHFQINLDDQNRVSEIGYEGVGCAICRAAGSMLSEAIKGHTLEEAEEVSGLFQEMMFGAEPTEKQAELLGDLTSMTGVRAFPIRIKCALLSLTALEEGISEYRSK
jgi:nitrogen fixation NifU-like protein